MRPLSFLMLSLLPLAAAGQSAANDSEVAQRLLDQAPVQVLGAQSDSGVVLWRSVDGRSLSVTSERGSETDTMRRNAPASSRIVDSSTMSTGLQYGLAPNLQAHAELSERSWANQSTRLIGGEIGATYKLGRYSVGLSVTSNTTPGNQSPVLPRIVPGGTPGVNGLSGFDSSAQFNARGRLALGSKSGIDLGASVGRVNLLPGNLMGINTLDQKALSFGVDHGPLSGALVGRTMQPQAGMPAGFSADRRWNSIDLGVTWRLPWRGSLSVGAQNLWSSGAPVNTPVGPEPDQSRTPYVQYHQDL